MLLHLPTFTLYNFIHHVHENSTHLHSLFLQTKAPEQRLSDALFPEGFSLCSDDTLEAEEDCLREMVGGE